MHLKHSLTALLLGTLLPLNLAALSSDPEQPIRIRAERVMLDDEKGMAIYHGEVEMEQGSLRLEAERVEVYRKEGKLDALHAFGSPVRFRQRPDDSDTDIRGEALSIDYRADSSLLKLRGAAKIWQAEDRFSGEQIDYNVEQGRVEAAGTEGSRVEVIFGPQGEETKP